MTSAGVHESLAAEPAVPAGGARASATPAALDGLCAAVGNRSYGSYVRTLPRQPATQALSAQSVTVGLVTPPAPPPIHASERATIPNRRLIAVQTVS